MDSNQQSDYQKYWEGKTSLKEELQLRNQTSLSPEEKNYFNQLTAFSKLEMKTEITIEELANQELEDKSYKRPLHLYWMRIAAGFLLLVSISIFYNWSSKKQQESLAARAAFDEARNSLLLMSSKLNKGSSTTTYQLKKFSVAQHKIRSQESGDRSQQN